MKLFLAIDLPEEIKTKLQKQMQPFKQEYQGFRWIEPQNYHITLFNFGNMFGPDKIKKIVDEAIFEIPPFRLYSSENSLLMRNDIMLYVGFSKSQVLESMVRKMKEGFKLYTDYTFFPHLTVARTKIASKQQYLLMKKKFARHPVDIEFEVTHLTLFEAVVENKVSQYRVIHTYDLYTSPA